MNPVKLIVTHKANLQWKYGSNFSKINTMLKKLQDADRKKALNTKIVFVDDDASAKKAGVKKIKIFSEPECKRIVDDLYQVHVPAYIVIFGAQDVIPFQEIDNPAKEDGDVSVPSDLPYACDAPFSRKIEKFTGPTRVVGRIPDIPGQQPNTNYLQTIIDNSIAHKPMQEESYHNYFAISALVWKKSTELSLQSMFGHNGKLINSPNGAGVNTYKSFTKKQLSPLTHFYNCHGADIDLSFYGQRGNSYPEALRAVNLPDKIEKGTVVAAECCYGAQLFDPVVQGFPSSSIANTYLANDAIAFLGSSTIAYGPSDSQGLADLITQYFIKNVLKGASTGRAFLEARQRFITVNGPDLDPYELKTLAQFYLLGDPSVQPAACEDAEVKSLSVGSAIMNSRKNLFAKGKNLEQTTAVTTRQKTMSPIRVKMPVSDQESISIDEILKKNKFTKADKSGVFSVKPKGKGMSMAEKKMGGQNVKFHSFVQEEQRNKHPFIRVLIVKENTAQILGWRVYESR